VAVPAAAVAVAERVPLDEIGEVVERLRRERLDREVGHVGNVSLVADVRRR
jgi:hypothetical protein